MNTIYNELSNNEKILWEGQPNNKLFVLTDLLIIPFSIMWTSFVVGFEMTTFRAVDTPLFFKLWGVPFILVGLYLLFGRFIYKSYISRNTYYYVTNKRVIIRKELQKPQTTSIYLLEIDEIHKRICRNDKGTIRLGSSLGLFSLYENTGLEPFARGRLINNPPVLYNIDNAEDVYKLILNAKEKNRLNETLIL